MTNVPLYEYRCRECGAKTTLLMGMTAETEAERCQSCGSINIIRLVSRVGKARTEEQRLDDFADRIEQMGEPESYSEMKSTLREAGSALDDSMADEMEEMFEDHE